jgi:hypothetical protein
MDGGGLLYHDKDPIAIAGLLDALVSNARCASRCCAQDAA